MFVGTVATDLDVDSYAATVTHSVADVVSIECSLPCKGAITSKIKNAIKLKTSPARLARLLQPSLAFCFSLQPMTAHP